MELPHRGPALLTLLALLLILQSPAPAHGGRYFGPIGEVDPAKRLPEDHWGDDRSYPITSGTFVNPDSWRFAWHAVENGILEERAARRRPAIASPGMAERILPALRTFVAAEKLDRDIIAAAILGLARNGVVEAVPDLRTRAWDRDEERRYGSIVEERSALALGLLADPDGKSAALLRRIAADPESRHRTRAFAMFALAFRGSEEAGAETLETLGTALDSGEGDLPASAAFALGRIGGPGPAALLLQRLSDPPPPLHRVPRGYPDRTDLLRAHLSSALGRAAAGTGPEVEEPARVVLLAETRTGRRLPVIGAVAGLGGLGAGAGERTASLCVDHLDDLLLDRGTEPHARVRASMALAEIAACGPGKARTAARAALAKALEAARPDLSTASLALGLALRDAPEEEREAAAARIRVLVAREGGVAGPEDGKTRPPFLERAGGGILALGLLGDLRSRPALERILADPGENHALRGCAAEALGLLGDAAALPLLRSLAADRRFRGFGRELAIALGLLGDRESGEAIFALLSNPKNSAYVLGGCSQALGWLSDAATVEPLLLLAHDDEQPDLTRAFAVQALGRMAARARKDPFPSLTGDGLYRASFDALLELCRLL